jgi:DHA2 family multidrug resistance protein
VRRHDAFEIGTIMLVTGVAQLVTAPLAAMLESRIGARLLTACGFALFAVGLGLSAFQPPAADFDEMFWPQIVRGIAIMFCLLPPTRIALGALPEAEVADASGLFNLMRNLGGAVGLAVINQVLNERTDLHISRLHERVNWGNATAVETLNMFTQRMQGMGDAALMAMKQLSQIVHRQAVVMGYGDAFFMLTVFYFGLSLLVMLLKKPSAMAAGAAEH